MAVSETAAAGARGGGADAILRALKLNFVLRHARGLGALGRGLCAAELACHYRVPRVRFLVRTRAGCHAGRCRAVAAARMGSAVAWLAERAPLWVLVNVCALLRDADDEDDEWREAS